MWLWHITCFLFIGVNFENNFSIYDLLSSEMHNLIEILKYSSERFLRFNKHRQFSKMLRKYQSLCNHTFSPFSVCVCVCVLISLNMQWIINVWVFTYDSKTPKQPFKKQSSRLWNKCLLWPKKHRSQLRFSSGVLCCENTPFKGKHLYLWSSHNFIWGKLRCLFWLTNWIIEIEHKAFLRFIINFIC